MYWMYEMAHASFNPTRAVTDATKILAAAEDRQPGNHAANHKGNDIRLGNRLLPGDRKRRIFVGWHTRWPEHAPYDAIVVASKFSLGRGHYSAKCL